MAGTKILELKIIAFKRITIINKYVSLIQILIFHSMLQCFILKSRHMSPSVLCLFAEVFNCKKLACYLKIKTIATAT